MNCFVRSLNAAILFGGALTMFADSGVTVNVLTNRREGVINQRLSGVSQGGNACSYMKPQVVAGMKELPAKMVRLEMVTGTYMYSLYNPQTKTWNWSKLDREIENIRKSGAEIVINLYGTPTWMSSEPKAKIPIYAPPIKNQEFADYCAAIVRHVNIEKKYNIKYWEFWNEPSGGYFWSTWKQNPKPFFDLYAATAKAVKKVDPSIMFGGFGDNVYYQENYRAFYEYCKKHNTPVDFISIHWYGEWDKEGPRHPEWFNTLTAKAEAMYKKYFNRTVPIFYTEWNLIGESKGKYSAGQTAAYIGTALYWMQRNPKISGAMLFRVEHYKDSASSLFDAGFQPRVAWRVMKMFTMLPKTELRTVSSDKAVTALAAGSPDHAVVMINRYGIDSKEPVITAKLIFSGLAGGKTYRLNLYQENTQTAGKVQPFAPVSTREIKSDMQGRLTYELNLDAYSVTLVAVEKQ